MPGMSGPNGDRRPELDRVTSTPVEGEDLQRKAFRLVGHFSTGTGALHFEDAVFNALKHTNQPKDLLERLILLPPSHYGIKDLATYEFVYRVQQAAVRAGHSAIAAEVMLRAVQEAPEAGIRSAAWSFALAGDKGELGKAVIQALTDFSKSREERGSAYNACFGKREVVDKGPGYQHFHTYSILRSEIWESIDRNPKVLKCLVEHQVAFFCTEFSEAKDPRNQVVVFFQDDHSSKALLDALSSCRHDHWSREWLEKANSVMGLERALHWTISCVTSGPEAFNEVLEFYRRNIEALPARHLVPPLVASEKTEALKEAAILVVADGNKPFRERLAALETAYNPHRALGLLDESLIRAGVDLLKQANPAKMTHVETNNLNDLVSRLPITTEISDAALVFLSRFKKSHPIIELVSKAGRVIGLNDEDPFALKVSPLAATALALIDRAGRMSELASQVNKFIPAIGAVIANKNGPEGQNSVKFFLKDVGHIPSPLFITGLADQSSNENKQLLQKLLTARMGSDECKALTETWRKRIDAAYATNDPSGRVVLDTIRVVFSASYQAVRNLSLRQPVDGNKPFDVVGSLLITALEEAATTFRSDILKNEIVPPLQKLISSLEQAPVNPWVAERIAKLKNTLQLLNKN